MVFRKPGTLLPLEASILGVAQQAGAAGTYGFALATDLAARSGDRHLAAHGTMYKALDRLSRNGLLDSSWEAPEIAEAAGRPRRKIYRITGAGARALEGGYLRMDAPGTLGESPA
jgi:DNA-binding PadR family transcriptional regulator